ncbi:hypothetical protein GV827_21610 [Sulfitobacter sp. JBTF-M27]|uniref:Tetratricopeptide repeat protein n=1 Tax=Sulfitobacter sediminilitoris TaxID=2698830 RepID=A0A6P0CHV1_9RHOB|nr:hypothetical protein [Sulfitobacter sediminilitoris]NEK24970.1 hypothetical protein [Sulfitobacter sediminilitoris]
MKEREALFTLIALAFASAGVAVLLVPRGELNREGQLAAVPRSEALMQLDAAQEPLTPQLAFRQAELTAASGDAQKADALLAALADRTTEIEAIASARADLALRGGDLALAAEHLARAQSAAPDRVRRQRLGLIYRRLGDTEAERALLSLESMDALSGWERVRLVDLTATEGATAQALALADFAVTLGGEQVPLLADRFIALALISEDFDAFSQVAARWLAGPDAPALAVTVAQGIATQPRQASMLAHSVVTLAPASRARMVEELTRARLYRVARELMQPWMDDAVPHLGGWSALILYADFSGDVSLLDKALRRLRPKDIVPQGAFLPLIRYGGGQALLPYQARMTPDFLANAPLVEASWAIWWQRHHEAFAALQRAARSETDPVLWRAVADGLQGTGYLERLKVLSQTDDNLADMFKT